MTTTTRRPLAAVRRAPAPDANVRAALAWADQAVCDLDQSLEAYPHTEREWAIRREGDRSGYMRGMHDGARLMADELRASNRETGHALRRLGLDPWKAEQ